MSTESTSTYRPPREHPHFSAADAGLLAAVAAGQARLTVEQGLELFKGPMSLPALGRCGRMRASRRTIHGDRLRTYAD